MRIRDQLRVAAAGFAVLAMIGCALDGDATASAAQTGGDADGPANVDPFELVQISLSPSPSSNVTANRGEYSGEGVTLLEAICTAYGVARTQVLPGFPFRDGRYSIHVKMPEGQEHLLWETLQKALEAHFGMAVRREPRLMDVYILTAPHGRPSQLRDPALKKGTRLSGRTRRVFQNAQVGFLAGELGNVLNRLVFDETGLRGRYDFELAFPRRSPESVTRAVREQLGLELTPARRPVEMLVIEKREGDKGAPLDLGPAAAPEGDQRIVDSRCGVEVTIPREWRLKDQSQGPITVKIYSPGPWETPGSAPVPRLSLLRIPLALVPQGLQTRAEVIKARAGVEVHLAETTLHGVEAQRMEYVAQEVRCVEFGVKRDGALVVMQVVAKEEDWQDPEGGKALNAIFESVRFARPGRAPAASRIDPSTPEEVREARRRHQPGPPPFAIRTHDLAVEIWPEEGRLVSTDRFEVEALQGDVQELVLKWGELVVDSVRVGGQALSEGPEGYEASLDALAIKLPAPLPRGETVTVEGSAHIDDFFFPVSSLQFQELQVRGQVRPSSTFSSHVLYYPIDERNDAVVRIALTVPEGYVAVTGGEAVGVKAEHGQTTYVYETKVRRPRLLPFGFAVAKYRSATAKTAGGLNLEFYYLTGDEKKAQQHLDLAVRAGRLFEQLMGPLPWRRVAVCHVQPERGEMGVSLPGLVLMSDLFFRDLEGLRPQGANLSASLAFLLVPDELSHQWNAYAAQLPNELAEGVSTFTDLLFIEQEAGPAEYLAGIRHCAQTYMAWVDESKDVALAHPALMGSSCYRVVAFAKVPVVLHNLRRRLGDERFFKGWRRALGTAHDRGDPYDSFRQAFEEATGEDLRGFFDCWFFRAGYPHVSVTWKPDRAKGEHGMLISLQQVQGGGPFEIDCDLEIHTSTGEQVVIPVSLREQEVAFPFQLSGSPADIRIDPQKIALLRQVDPRRRDSEE